MYEDKKLEASVSDIVTKFVALMKQKGCPDDICVPLIKWAKEKEGDTESKDPVAVSVSVKKIETEGVDGMNGMNSESKDSPSYSSPLDKMLKNKVM